MKLIATKLGPNMKTDRLHYLRDDGSTCENPMPRQGILPHDLVHYIVESRLNLVHGFLGLVARGADAGFAMQVTHEAGNRDIEGEAIGTEAIVEALQTQLWNGAFDQDAFAYGVQMAANARGIATPALPLDQIESLVFEPAIELNKQWSQVQAHGSLELLFKPPAP